MAKVYSKALNTSLEIKREIGHITGAENGPTLVFVGGIHGNEPSGVFALRYVLDDLKERNVPLKGKIYALGGNLSALEKEKRFHQLDLNRAWTSERISKLQRNELEPTDNDTLEQIELYHYLKEIIQKETGPFYFMDLHTTSGPSIPFMTVSDSLLNRKFTQQFPVPLVLGIEEYLEGALLSYLNELGYVSFGFEGGQHDELAAIKNHTSFIYLTLAFSGCASKEDINFLKHYNALSKAAKGIHCVYEIYSRYAVRNNEEFVMKPGYINFQRVNKWDQLAKSNGKLILAERNGRILMPRYNNQGDDGYFFIRRVPQFVLDISAGIRRIKLDRLLPLLPGVSWKSENKESLKVDKRIARFLAKQFFHLMGYRSRVLDKDTYIMKNREAASKQKEYPIKRWKRLLKAG